MFKLFSRKTDQPKKVVKTVKEVVKEVDSKYKEIPKEYISKSIELKDKLDLMIKEFFDHDQFINDSINYANDELKDSIKQNIDHDFVYFHIYGDTPAYNNNISKVDFVKDCRTFQITITDVVDLRRSVKYLRHYIRRFDEFIEDFLDVFKKYAENNNYITENANENIFERIELMIDSFLTDNSYCFNVISNLVCILNRYYEENLDSIGEKLKFVKYDTLKRYYFTHTYSLKNSVKMFNKESMFFGEINNIMKQYNFIYNYVFGTLICDIQTIKTLFESIK